ncbi:MAG: hypothetical protein IPQ07_39380 [Myxococcales bacterium]|nr:hypothetical protein [Myxococcales bacterium]
MLVEIQGQATTIVALAPPGIALAKQGTFRWELAGAPSRSMHPQPEGGISGMFQPDVRGTYLVERWMTYGVAEDLTHRFMVEVRGAPPIAVSRTATLIVAVAQTVVVDGAPSQSPERLPLEYRWRLASRPTDSVAVISTPTGSQATLAPDTPGDYLVELSVFDGELWSVDPAPLTLNAH